MVAHKYDVSLSIQFYVFAHEIVARKYCGSFRSPKSYNLCLECLRLPQVKLLWQRFCHSRKRGPGNETLEKRKEQTVFYDRFQPLASPGNNATSREHVDIMSTLVRACAGLQLVTEVPVWIWIRFKFKLEKDRSVKTPWREYGVIAGS